MDLEITSESGCKEGQGKPSKHSTQLGLDELMIVNPAASGIGGLFEGPDGAVYQLQGVSEEAEELGQLFLGDDGSLYRAESSKALDRTKMQQDPVSSSALGKAEQIKLADMC